MNTFQYSTPSSQGVSIGDCEFYFSYKTVIAFNTPKTGLIIRENDWNTTTGKHLNAVNPDKKQRISGEKFEEKLAEMEKLYQVKGVLN